MRPMARLQAWGWNAPGLEDFHLGGVVIDANDLMADLGETGPGDQPNISRSNNCQFHKAVAARS